MGENRKDRIYKTVMLVFITFFITFTLACILMYNRFSSDGNLKYIMLSGDKGDVATEIEKIQAVVERKYLDLDKVDKDDLIDGAVKGYIKALGDEYASYMTDEEWKTYQEEALGNYQGVGLYLTITTDTNEIIVMSPITESAADKAGIKSGDIITKVNGVAYNGDQLEEAANAMQGPVGESVKVEIKRGKEIKEFEITRELVRMAPITTQMLEKNIGYMQMTNFDEGIGADFVSKYNKLKDDGAKAIILDLRFNGGGYISGARDILDALLPKDSVLFVTKGTSGEIVEKAETTDMLENLPMVVLQNNYSASASEILTGALKDYKRATIVGTTSYGKGVLQSVFMLDGAALKLTTDEFFTASRNKIQGVGIQPDHVVEIDKSIVDSFTIPRDKDKQLDKAIELLSKK